MGGKQIGNVLRYVRGMVGAPAGAPTDRDLLERFSRQQDQEAFALLVDRHGPMVLGVCRRLLHDAHTADDAFQATFLVLARKAGSVCWHTSVGGWLYEAAYRIAFRARGEAERRRFHERQAGNLSRAESLSEEERRELRAVLDEELSRLPRKYSNPLVLCYLEGKTNEEAARELGWTKGTVSGRLARARDLLRGRLARRGLALSAALFVTELAREAAAAVPAPLARAAVQAAQTLGAVGAVSAPVAALVTGVMWTMFLTKLKTVLVITLLIAAVGGAAVLAFRPLAPAPEGLAPKEAVKEPDPVKGLKLTLKADHPAIQLSPFQKPDEVVGYSLIRLGLVCTFTNVSDRPIKLDAHGPEGKIKLDLKGPDGKSVAIFKEQLALEPLPPPAVEHYPTIAPGQSWTTRFPLSGGWTMPLANLPGRYTLEAAYTNPMEAKNEFAAQSWTGRVVSNSVAVMVQGSGGPEMAGLKLALVLDAPETFRKADGSNAEPVKVRMVFTNSSKKPYKLDVYDLFWRNLRVEVKGPDGRGVRMSHSAINRTLAAPRAEDFPVLEPGKTWVSDVGPSFPGPFGGKVYALLEAGDYRVRVFYDHTPFKVRRNFPEVKELEAGCWNGEVSSNEVVLRVLPNGAEAVNGLKLTLSADETVTALGPAGAAEPVQLRFTFTNTTNQAIRLNVFDLLYSGLELEVTGPDQAGVQRIQADRVRTWPPISLDFWAVMAGKNWSPPDVPFPGGPHIGGTGYRLVQPGEYRIRAAYAPTVPNAREAAAVKSFGGDSWAGRLTSNVLVLKVRPAAEAVRDPEKATAAARVEAEKALDEAYAEYRKWAAEKGGKTPKHEGLWIGPTERGEVVERPGGWQVRWTHAAKAGYSYSVTLEVRRNGKVHVIEASASFASA
jgi:RNA polymerase sigma factor (sigma-70 family)